MTSQSLALVKPSIPPFEGAAVEGASIKISGNCPVESADDVLISIDDRVRLVGEYRVVGVNFKVDPKTGDTIREQLLKPISVQLCPWDPSDPTDDGIVRARPQVP
jgi:hypothetical protein